MKIWPVSPKCLATHFAATRALRRLKGSDTIRQQDSNGNLAVKLLRTFTAQAEALQRYRGKGQQKVMGRAWMSYRSLPSQSNNVVQKSCGFLPGGRVSAGLSLNHSYSDDSRAQERNKKRFHHSVLDPPAFLPPPSSLLTVAQMGSRLWPSARDHLTRSISLMVQCDDQAELTGSGRHCRKAEGSSSVGG